jgi:hypothetical protein
VWALVETAFWFPSSGGRRSSVHGCGSVHAVVELRKDVRELHHLTGHYHDRQNGNENQTAFDAVQRVISATGTAEAEPDFGSQLSSYMAALGRKGGQVSGTKRMEIGHSDHDQRPHGGVDAP